MKIRRFRIRNYKSWEDSGDLTFEDGLNIVVGKNNSGKTAMLDALSLTKGNNPHVSKASKPTASTIIDSHASFSATFEFEENEMNEIVMSSHFDHVFVPCSDESIPLPRALTNAVRKLKAKQCVTTEFVDSNLMSASFESNWYSPSQKFIKCSLDLSTKALSLSDTATIYKQKHVGKNILSHQIIEHTRKQIFIFKAERFTLAESPIRPNDHLNPSCDNLAQVLHFLQSKNHSRFQRFLRLVSTVFPDVKTITTPPVGNGTQIRIWNVDPETERDDLSYPLSECGTGIGQVLAMLYVIISSDHPQCLLVDEPQSFLHPGAIRSLIEIFQKNSQHQYIITTHSPVIVSTPSSQLIHIQHDGSKSTAHFFTHREANQMRLLLEDMGSKLSDVFGSDYILWVEGITEEECFKLILEKLESEPLRGLQILGVRSTGELQGKHSELVSDIYHRISHAGAIIPPTVGFIFDRENKTNQVIEDLRRRMRGRVHFLDRRMFENYLLVPAAIAELIKQIPEFRRSDVTAEEIETLISANESKRPTPVHLPLTEPWCVDVHGAGILTKLFSVISNGLVTYRKVEHGYKLTEIILRSHPNQFSEIHTLLKSVIAGKSGLG